jgi:hypothetical protein
MECMAGKMRGGDVMRIRAKNTATIMLLLYQPFPAMYTSGKGRDN